MSEAKIARNLGLFVDNGLTFEKHVDAKVKHLYRLRPDLTTEVKQRMVDALVLSQLDYGDRVYRPCLPKQIEKEIQRVQNSCVRFCFKVPPRSHITPYLNKFNIFNMSNRRTLKLNSFVHSLRKTSIPTYMAKKFNRNDRVHGNMRSVRYPSLQISPPARLTPHRGSFKFAASKC